MIKSCLICVSFVLQKVEDSLDSCIAERKLVGALSPINHKGLHQSWKKKTSLNLQVLHSTSNYTTNLFSSNHNSTSIHNFRTQTQKNSNTYFGTYLYSAGTQHGNLHSAGWPILFCGPTQEPVLATANAGKTRERFWENAGEWTGRIEISKEEIHCSKRSMYGYIVT